MTARRDIEAITERIRQRSKAGREAYLANRKTKSVLIDL